MALKDHLDRLGNLYTPTGEDWVFSMSQILTEPCCPSAIIHPERWNISRYRVDCDSLEEFVEKVVNLVYTEIIDRKVMGTYCPYSNPDDDVFAKWLYARANGDDSQMPERPVKHRLPEGFKYLVDGIIWNLDKNKLNKRDASTKFLITYINATISYCNGYDRLDKNLTYPIIKERLLKHKVLNEEELGLPEKTDDDV